ncbi:TrkA C-terminal domain-containing protein [Capillimicrobium parvum]|uniref:RCK C-terminal domain-containing protein n=1 Tax=Capillimicrobium parvum TaxID=2884022 RepID=A0A9E6XX79_9ACTN|nr:TrkA C-terminal domain-containing protein [Capillimicrobium parvum]UGS35437.1 hypothetical protein DSM104329_01825 [Capillimicrobium parvum]
MEGVIAIFAAIVVLGLILRTGTEALVLTGLSRDIARFQVRSAFFGVGYTTAEAETIVNHPLRRRIVQMLLVAGAIGISGVVSSSILTLARQEDSIVGPLLGLVGATLLLWAAMSVKPLDRLMTRIVAWGLRRATNIDTRDYDALLRIHDQYSVTQITIRPDGILAGRSLAEVAPESPGIVLLGIERAEGGEYVGAPPLDTRIEAGDVLTIYGRDDVLARMGGAAPAPRR